MIVEAFYVLGGKSIIGESCTLTPPPRLLMHVYERTFFASVCVFSRVSAPPAEPDEESWREGKKAACEISLVAPPPALDFDTKLTQKK